MIASARALVTAAVDRRIFPAAVAEVGDSERILWREAFGRLTFDADARPTSEATIFDLASLTKPLATTIIVLNLAATGAIDLQQPIAECFEEWRGVDREGATIRDLLEHASGLAARLIDPPPTGRREFEHEICGMPLEYPIRSKSIYSDLGFILLGFLAADRGGARLDSSFQTVADRLRAAIGDQADPISASAFLAFAVPAALRADTASTRALDEDRRRGQRLTATVHDNYAAALSGVAGHAGLFGNVGGIAAFARALLRCARECPPVFAPFTYPWVMMMARRSTVPGSSRALGWDTMLPTSSCGAGMSFAAFGHVGYTGTSLWIDPILDRYFILLTNRVCDGGSIHEMQQVRRGFHDALVTID